MHKDLRIYSHGLVHCSVCVPKEMTMDEIENAVNEINPTGISSPWVISSDKNFSDGLPMPTCCNEDPARMHYLLSC